MRFMSALILALMSLPVPAMAQKAPTAEVEVKVTLYPAGSFSLKTSTVVGQGIRAGNKYTAHELKVPVASLKSGIDLRDHHTQEHLQAKEFPFVVVQNVEAQGDSGKAKITIMKTTKEIAFKFKDLGNKSAQATFKLNLPEFGIKDINYMGVGVEDNVEVIATIPYSG